jgi:hypothetical protein
MQVVSCLRWLQDHSHSMLKYHVLEEQSSSEAIALPASLRRLSFHGDLELYLPLILLAYLVGHIVNYLSSMTIERFSVWTAGYPSQYLLNTVSQKWLLACAKKNTSAGRWSMRALVMLFIAPILFLDWIFLKLHLRSIYIRPTSLQLRRCINQSIIAIDKEKQPTIAAAASESESDSDSFRLVYHYCVENAPNHFPKMQNYLALYGFTRATSLVLVVAFWFSCFPLVFQSSWPSSPIIPICLALSSFLMYLAFVKFYRKFTLEAFMAYCSLRRSQDGDS